MDQWIEEAASDVWLFKTKHAYLKSPHYITIQNLLQTCINDVSKGQHFLGILPFKHDKVTNLLLYRAHLNTSFTMVEQILGFEHEYDFSPTVKGNGYRSLVLVFDAFVQRNIPILTKVWKEATNITSLTLSELMAWRKALGSFALILKQAIVIREESEEGSLFSTNKQFQAEAFERFKSAEYDCFYGYCLGFQFHETMRFAVEFSRLAFVSYSQVHGAGKSHIMRVMGAAVNFVKCLFDPELLGIEMTKLNYDMPPSFLTDYAAGQENKIPMLCSLKEHWLAVDTEINLPPVDIIMQSENGNIVIPAPSNLVKCRLLSTKVRKGMMQSQSFKGNKLAVSDCLLIFIHGGGFVASTTKLHQVYLNEWARKLDLPIFCIDYTLAPEAQFPHQGNEVLFAYCWAIQNMNLLGCTGDKVVVAGDSAGGNLSLVVGMKAVELKIKPPTGLLLIYALTMMDAICPSRLLQVMDPTIPYGLLVKCLEAYIGDAEESNPYLSPLLQEDHILSQLPPTSFVTTNLDMLLDDNVSMAKKLQSLGVPTKLMVLSGLPHGFLLFNWICKEAHEGSKACLRRMRELFNIPCPTSPTSNMSTQSSQTRLSSQSSQTRLSSLSSQNSQSRKPSLSVSFTN